MQLRNLLLPAVLATTTLGFLAGGCASQDRHEVVPPTAVLGAEGSKMLTYTTSGPGTVYVYDVGKDQLVYSGQVESGRSITVDPEKNQILVDGTLVQDKTLSSGDNYRIFFQPRHR
jgi:hypothetical protein